MMMCCDQTVMYNFLFLFNCFSCSVCSLSFTCISSNDPHYIWKIKKVKIDSEIREVMQRG